MITNWRSSWLLNKFSFQYLRKYIENSKENLHTDVGVLRVGGLVYLQVYPSSVRWSIQQQSPLMSEDYMDLFGSSEFSCWLTFETNLKEPFFEEFVWAITMVSFLWGLLHENYFFLKKFFECFLIQNICLQLIPSSDHH